jgi:hypothetical protein
VLTNTSIRPCRRAIFPVEMSGAYICDFVRERERSKVRTTELQQQ